MVPSRKCIDMAADLAYELGIRGLTIVSSVDSSGNPTITFGTVATGNSCGSIRLKEPSIPGVDSLGNTQAQFAQTLMQICLEGSDGSIGGTETAKYVQAAQMMDVLGQMAVHGTRIDMYLTADGTAPSITNLDASGVLVKTFDPSLKFRLIGQQ